MKRLAFIFLLLLTPGSPRIEAQGLDAEDLLRNLPSPEVNYPLEDIRVVPEGQYIRATEPVALPPPEPSYEAKKLVESLKSAGSSQVITSTRKLISTLAKPAATIQNASATAAARALASQTREIVKATRPAPVEIPSTKVVATARTLAANPAVTLFKNRLASDAALAEDIFELFVKGQQPEETGETVAEEGGAAEKKFDSIMVTAAGLQKKQAWNEIKNLFAENPEAGETPEGLRLQIEAELNSAKPNYMAGQRFANQLIKTETNDPLANYALALYFYNSKKPNVDRAQKALAIALKAKNPPEGASTLYWTMTLKKLALPLLLLLGGLIAGANHFIKKRKAASLNLAEEANADSSGQKNDDNLAVEAKPESPFKTRLQSLKEKIQAITARLPFGRKKAETVSGNETPASTGSDAAPDTMTNEVSSPSTTEPAYQKVDNATTAVSEIESEAAEDDDDDGTSDDKDSEIFELEGEDSALLEESDETDTEFEEDPALEKNEEIESAEEVEEIIEEVEEIEEIEEIIEEEEVEEIEDGEIEYIEVEESELDSDTEVEYEEIEVVEEVEEEIEDEK